MEAVDVFMLEKEVAALREKLADTISEGADFRATVAAALAELRTSLVNAQQVIPTADAFDAFNIAIGRLNATIAKLGLINGERETKN